MGSSNFLTDWGKYPDGALPQWLQDATLGTGSYVSPGGYATSFTARPSGAGKLFNGFAKALCRAIMIFNGCNADGYGSNADFSIAEMTMSGIYEGNDVGRGEVATVVYDKKTGNFYAEKGGIAYELSKNGPAALILAMWDHLMEDTSFGASFGIAADVSKSDDERKSAALYMCDFFYEGLKTGKYPTGDSSAKLKNLTPARRADPRYRPSDYVGTFAKFGVTNYGKGKAKQKNKTVSTKEFLGAFAFSKNTLTPEQEARVPKLDDKYIVTDELLLVCKHIKETTGTSRPIRNILYRGAPGVGKSESYVGIAAGCHLPLYTFAANALTEPFDLFGQFVPVDDEGNQVGEKVPIEKILSGMPSAEDISMDPGFAYQQITGLQKKDATPTECMAAMFNLAQKSLDVNGGQQRFKFAPGQLIYALRDGGVWGFDEVTLPQNPGVVPALNPAMDSTQAITLPTGEVIHRHPDCIIVGTTNIDLEGCRQMNQAWMDRCQLIIELPEPPDEVLLSRIKSMVDWDEQRDSKVVDLNRFLKVYKELKELSRKHRMDDGTIGPRKFADWVQSTLVTGDPVISAKMTIIPGASTDPRNMEELEQKLRDSF